MIQLKMESESIAKSPNKRDFITAKSKNMQWALRKSKNDQPVIGMQ